jgi:putative transposase
MDGRKFRTLNIIDDFNREALKIVAARSLTSKYVTQYLDEVSKVRGYPCALRTDNGPEYKSHVLKDWAKLHGVSCVTFSLENLHKMLILNDLTEHTEKKY